MSEVERSDERNIPELIVGFPPRLSVFLYSLIPLPLDHTPCVQGRLVLAPSRPVGEFTIYHLISALLGLGQARLRVQRHRDRNYWEPCKRALGSTEWATYLVHASIPYFSSL